MARISVIVPTYNRAHFVAEAIESILAQTYRDYEIVVIDDGSTDDTVSVVDRFAEHVTFLQQPHSGIPAVTRNTGLRWATGEYIAFLDSDDLFLPPRLERHVAVLDSRPALEWTYSDVVYFCEDGSEAGTLLRPSFTPAGWVFPHQIVDNFIGTCSLTVRRRCLESVGYFDETPGLVEDYELCLRISAEHEIEYVPGVLSRARIHGQNISGGTKLGQYLGAIDALDRTARRFPALVAPYRAALRERRSLLRLAATRACLRSRSPFRVAGNLAACLAANPRPGWWAYLLSRPHPARDWLAKQETLLSSVGPKSPNSERKM